ncbi:MAG: uncharacterized protein QOF76_4541, partial [Solirubrobacteraceae bacterium]|nr:uncharacterized protein [Solirubrobacteraceae bacterium]
VCRTPPGAPGPVCKQVSFGAGQPVARTYFTVAKRGRWALSIKSPQQKIKRILNVGVKPLPGDLATLPSLVTTGDSLMQGPDALLEDRLDDQAVVHSDVHVGSGLTRPFIIDWQALPSKQLKEYKPDAVMLFLGANDNTAIGSVGCCTDDWVAEYAKLARQTMMTYTKGGAQVFWLNIPIPEQEDRQPNALAVNKALLQAAAGMPDVHIVDIASVFTPGNVYRETMEYNGQVVHIRQSDGLHLSVAGSSITDKIIVEQLKKYGVL